MALDKRQKVLLPLVVIAFAYVGWQVYSMLTPANSQAPMVGTTKKLIASQQETNQPSSTPAPKAAAAPAATYGSRQSSTSATKEQTQYLQLLNRYQLLKMKHMLLDEEVAIATAKQKIAELNSQTNKLGGSIDYSGDVDNMDVDAQTSLDTPTNTGDYAVVYIDRQNGQWNATLNNRGHFEEATIGSILSDGSKVVAIDSSGATIKQGDQLLKLTFSGPVAASSQAINQEDNVAEENVIQSNEPIPAKPAIEIKTPAVTKPIIEEKKPVVTPAKIVKETQPAPVIEVPKKLETPVVPPVKKVKQEPTLTKPVVKAKELTLVKPPVIEEKKLVPVQAIKEISQPKPVITTKVNPIIVPPTKEVKKESAPIKPVVEEKKPVATPIKIEIKKAPAPIVPIVEKKNIIPIKNEVKEAPKPTIVTKEISKPLIIKETPKPVVLKKIETPITSSKPLVPTEVKKEIIPIVVKTKEPTPIKPVVEEKKPVTTPAKIEIKREPVPIAPIAEKKNIVPVKNEVKEAVKPTITTKEIKKDDLKDFSLKKPTSVAPTSTSPISSPAPKQSDEMAKLLDMLEKDNAAKTSAAPVITLEAKNKKDVKPAPVVIDQKPIVSLTTTTTKTGSSEKAKTATNDIQTLSTVTSGKPNHYALQLMGGEDVADIKNFVKANKLDGQANISKTSRNGKDWYILLYGSYPTSSKAITATKNLPVTLKNLDPWVKPIY